MWNNHLPDALNKLDAALSQLVNAYQKEIEHDLERLQFALDMHRAISTDTDDNDRVE